MDAQWPGVVRVLVRRRRSFTRIAFSLTLASCDHVLPLLLVALSVTEHRIEGREVKKNLELGMQ